MKTAMPKSAHCLGQCWRLSRRTTCGSKTATSVPAPFCAESISRGAGFITRQHEGLPFTVVTSWRTVRRIETGHVAEQRVEVRDTEGCAHLFRRIQVKLDQATRDGDRVLYLLTNLPIV